jgi:hypothetical protein
MASLAPASGRRARAVGWWLFALALGVYLFTAGGSLTSTDAVVTFDVTENLIDHGSVAMSGNLLNMEAHRGRDGRYYSPFGILQSLYNVPFDLAGRAMVAATGLRAGKSTTIRKAAVALGQTLVVAIVIWQVFRLSLFVTGDLTAATLAAVTMAFGSLLWPYARFGFNQPLAALTLLAGVIDAVAAVRSRAPGRAARAGLWLGLSLLTRHEMGLAAVPVTLWLAFGDGGTIRGRRRELGGFVAVFSAAIAAWLIYNAVRFGDPLDSGFLRDTVPGFGSPILEGLAGLLFSPAASVFLYSPVAIFGVVGLAMLMKRDRALGLLLASLPIVFLLLYATLGNWIGGRSYGGRYLVVVLPYLGVGWAALLATRTPRTRRRLAAAVIGIGIAVQIPGVCVDYAKVSQAATAGVTRASAQQRRWRWDSAPIVRNTHALATMLPDNVDYVLDRTPRPDVPTLAVDDDRGFSQQYAFSLDFWWLYLFYLRVVPRAVLVVVVPVFLAWTIAAARGLATSLRGANAG